MRDAILLSCWPTGRCLPSPRTPRELQRHPGEGLDGSVLTTPRLGLLLPFIGSNAGLTFGVEYARASGETCDTKRIKTPSHAIAMKRCQPWRSCGDRLAQCFYKKSFVIRLGDWKILEENGFVG